MSNLYQPGTTIAGHYTVTGVLGSGGMANVYRARDTVMNRTVAVKVFGSDGQKSSPRSFMTEARAAAVLSHPNIVSIYDVLDLSGEKYIIMEYICGITLRDYLDHHGHLSVKESVNCARQVLRALHAAHSRGVVHRDIKPGNILITTEGRIKITDFGIARLPDRDSFLMPDRTVGTVHYISPEQAGGGSVDERSDLYSLGIVLYEMLTGRRPFEAKNPADVAMMQISTRPQPLSYRNPAVPSALKKIVLCALEKDPSARFDSAAEMLRMLDRLSDDLLSGRVRPLREEGSAYRKAIEGPDERTMPLPKSWFRRADAPTAPPAEGQASGDAAIVDTPAAPPADASPSPVAEAVPARELKRAKRGRGRAAEESEEAPVPVPSDPLDAFTAEDTVDIMLSGVGAEVVVPAPDANHSATAAPKSGAERVSEPIAEREDAIGEKKGKKKKKAHFADSPFFFAGESRIFTWIMALAALILTVILIVGIVRARRTDADTPETASAPPALSCCLEKIPDPEGYHAR